MFTRFLKLARKALNSLLSFKLSQSNTNRLRANFSSVTKSSHKTRVYRGTGGATPSWMGSWCLFTTWRWVKSCTWATRELRFSLEWNGKDRVLLCGWLRRGFLPLRLLTQPHKPHFSRKLFTDYRHTHSLYNTAACLDSGVWLHLGLLSLGPWLWYR